MQSSGEECEVKIENLRADALHLAGQVRMQAMKSGYYQAWHEFLEILRSPAGSRVKTIEGYRHALLEQVQDMYPLQNNTKKGDKI